MQNDFDLRAGMRFSLDPRSPEEHHAVICSSRPDSTDPLESIAYVNGRPYQWRLPITQRILTARQWERFSERIMLRSTAILGAIGFLLALHFLLFGDAEVIRKAPTALSVHDARLFLFWFGIGSLLCLFAWKKNRGYQNHLLPVRSYEETLVPLPEDLRFIPLNRTFPALERSLHADGYLLMADAFTLAKQQHHSGVTPTHLFAAAEETKEMKELCLRLSIDRERLFQKVFRLLASYKRTLPEGGESQSTQPLYALLLRAFIECYKERYGSITITELLIACIDLDPGLREILSDAEITPEIVSLTGKWLHLSNDYQRSWQSLRSLARHKPKTHMNRALTARPTPLLDLLGTDYTRLAQQGTFPHLIGRENVLRECFRTLQSHLGNILLVGKPGTGKSEILKGMANLMAAEHVPRHLIDHRLIVLDPGALIGGAEGVGGVEGLSKRLLDEIASSGNILLAIEDIHHLLGAGSTRSSEDAGHMLMNALSEGKLRVVATTTMQEYSAHMQPFETFLRRFQVININEMDFFDTIRVLEAQSIQAERTYQVSFSFPSLKACYDLPDRLIPERYFPDKAIQIMEESAALARDRGRGVQGSGNTAKKIIVSKDDVARVMSRKTNVSVTRITESEADKLLRLEQGLHHRIVGQEEAVRAIASALRRARTGLVTGERPIANLLFLGPTGVGKTETAKTLAEVYFGSEKNMTRLDMSEYQTEESVHRLIGRTGQTSFFLNEVRRNPHRLILLDEFEKAHPDIANLFLQLFDDGRLTDGAGNTLDFSHALIIASSNAGSQRIQEGLHRGESSEQLKWALIHEELPREFPPELLNRFDHIIIFEPLTETNILAITRKMVLKLGETLEHQGIQLEISDSALRQLAARGHDRRYGARPLCRTIQDALEDPISKVILQGKVRRRDTIVINSQGIAIRKARVL